MLTVAIGYDRRESIAYHVLCHSIMRRASQPIRIVPINLANLMSIYTRPRSPQQSTDFTYARFLTPYLAEDNQVSVFLDCDMLCRTDICELEDYARSQLYADVLCVQHDYQPAAETKFLNQVQTTYPCKNWSSVMVFNGHRMAVKNLKPQHVNTMSPMDLHQFKWCDNVGTLPPEWNHLVGEYAPNPNAKLVHFTNGGPWFKDTWACEYADEWEAELKDMLHRDNPSFDLIRHWL